MSKKRKETKADLDKEKVLAPLAFLAGNPTNPFTVPFSSPAPEGLARVHSCTTPAEADLVRQILEDAGFHVEYVPATTTGVFGTIGNVDIYVQAAEANEAREFLGRYWEDGVEKQSRGDEV